MTEYKKRHDVRVTWLYDLSYYSKMTNTTHNCQFLCNMLYKLDHLFRFIACCRSRALIKKKLALFQLGGRWRPLTGWQKEGLEVHGAHWQGILYSTWKVFCCFLFKMKVPCEPHFLDQSFTGLHFATQLRDKTNWKYEIMTMYRCVLRSSVYW